MRHRERLAHPVSVTHEFVRLRNTPAYRQNQTHGQICHVICQHIWRMRDLYAAFLRGGHVNTVVTDAKNRNHFDVGKHCQQLAVDLGHTAKAYKSGDFGKCLGV